MPRSSPSKKKHLEIAHRWLTKWRKAVYAIGDEKRAREAYKRLQPLDSGDANLDEWVLTFAAQIMQREANKRPDAFLKSPLYEGVKNCVKVF